MSLRLFTVTALLAAVRMVSAASATEVAASDPTSGTDTVHGCYSSLGSLTFNQTYNFNTQGACAGFCRDMGKLVGASQAKDCYCGDKYPPKNTLVDDSQCTEPCPGFGTQACGGADTWTVYNTGVRVSVTDEANTTSSSTTGGSADSTSSQSVVTVSGSVVVITPTGEASNSGGGSKGSTVGIAVGSVVGVIGAAGLAGALFFFMKRRRNREIEEEHRRNAAVNAFIAGGKPPSSSGGMSISDQRLDPVMVQRRLSSGSIADEQDYSRRILRVTNA